MAEATKKTRTARPGYKHIYAEVTDAQYAALDKAAEDDDRKGGAPEMLNVILKRNLDKLIPLPWGTLTNGAGNAPTFIPVVVSDVPTDNTPVVTA